MADLVFLATTVGFFASMVLLVRACDHVIGPDGADLGDGGAVPAASEPTDRSEVPA
jgi:hypothetical protein